LAPVSVSDIVQVILLIVVSINGLLSWANSRMAKKNADGIEATHKATISMTEGIEAIHKATNSMKDQLVAVTGKEQFAAGVKVGTEAAAAGAAAAQSSAPEGAKA